ncbi:hypothetical protein IHN63_01485 [Deinococcus sp. 6YEL10]|uniref:hypothetical protein n=1 Tax=Deinococcus sp. 6YEL10 TaxID=2745870 RepID=UPI001E2B7F09|nr:hypothetical protein [Deinococcus sp. 6YEL10]MCD0159970.1 hypothetical protein [Deinococcus sp. 6YEL10]
MNEPTQAFSFTTRRGRHALVINGVDQPQVTGLTLSAPVLSVAELIVTQVVFDGTAEGEATIRQIRELVGSRGTPLTAPQPVSADWLPRLEQLLESALPELRRLLSTGSEVVCVYDKDLGDGRSVTAIYGIHPTQNRQGVAQPEAE